MREMGLLTAKPVIYAANMKRNDLMEECWAIRILGRENWPWTRRGCIPICAKTEEGYRGLHTPEEKKEFLAEMGIEATGLDNLIKASYGLLGLISF